MNILVVDDEYYIVKNLLQNIHWHDLGIDRAYPAYNAEQAKEIIRNDSIDIILLDIDMPRESGLQLIAEIHEQGYDPLVILPACQKSPRAPKVRGLIPWKRAKKKE